MKKKLLTVFVALPVVFLAPRVIAHEGHGNPQWRETVFHYLLEPIHALFAVLAAVGFGLMLAIALRKWLRFQQRPGNENG